MLECVGILLLLFMDVAYVAYVAYLRWRSVPSARAFAVAEYMLCTYVCRTFGLVLLEMCSCKVNSEMYTINTSMHMQHTFIHLHCTRENSN